MVKGFTYITAKMELKMKKILFFFLSVVLLLASCQQKEQSNKENSKGFSIGEQKTNKRNFSPIKLEELKTLYYKENKVFNPIAIRVDEQNNIYLHDFADQKIKQIKDEKIIEYGEGKGKGPKEFMNIVDFRIKNGTIYIVDNILNKIALFKKDGDFLKVFKSETYLNRIEILSNNIVSLANPTSSNKYFLLFDMDFKLIQPFADRLDGHFEPVKRLFYSTGSLTSDKNNTIYFGFRYYGALLSYNINTNGYTVMRTIDETDFPVIKMNKNGIAAAPRNVPIPCRNIAFDNDKLFVYTNAGEDIYKKKIYVIDVYNANNITYLYSIKLPFKLYRLTIKNNRLYGIDKERNIRLWKIIL